MVIDAITPIEDELLLDEDSSEEDEELAITDEELSVGDDELMIGNDELAMDDRLLLLGRTDELASEELTDELTEEEDDNIALELNAELRCELAITELAVALLLLDGVPPPPPHAVSAIVIAATHRFLCSFAIKLIIVQYPRYLPLSAGFYPLSGVWWSELPAICREISIYGASITY